MSDAVTVPPGLLMRSTTARTRSSSSAFSSSSRTRARSGTWGRLSRVKIGSSASTPERSIRSTFSAPSPATVLSVSGRTGGVRSIDTTLQPESVTRAITRQARRERMVE